MKVKLYIILNTSIKQLNYEEDKNKVPMNMNMNIYNGIFHISFFKVLLIKVGETTRGERESGRTGNRGETTHGENGIRGETTGFHESVLNCHGDFFCVFVLHSVQPLEHIKYNRYTQETTVFNFSYSLFV